MITSCLKKYVVVTVVENEFTEFYKNETVYSKIRLFTKASVWIVW